MIVLDWKHPKLIFDDWRNRVWEYPSHTDVPEDCRLAGFCPVAKRSGYVIAVRDGYYWVIGTVRVSEFDGVHLVRAVRSDVRYTDDDDIKDVQS